MSAGYFLGDVYLALGRLGCSIELRTNHRSNCDLIVSNAVAITRKRLPVIDPVQNFHQISIEQGRGDLSCGEKVGRILADMGL